MPACSYNLQRLRVTVCGLELRSFGRGDFIIIDDPWADEPVGPRYRLRMRRAMFRWRRLLYRREYREGKANR